MRPTEPGSLVHVRGEDWRVVRVDAYDGCAILTLHGGAARRTLRVIEPFDRPLLRRPRLKRRRRRAVLRAALSTIANARPPLGLWTAAAAAIDLLPYQLEPALAVLRGATRLLLADAVGLGKTIEAGLILSELRARGWVERALILCPAGLRATWAGELQQRFRIGCAVFDQAAIAEAAAALPPGVNPWTGHPVIVTSIDLAKRDDVRAALDGIPFDLLIADEAHHLTPGTDRGETVRRLASRTPWCVYLSATPHSGDEAAFTYLSALGSHGDALTIFRRSGRQTGGAAVRRERIVRVRASEVEAEMIATAAAYALAIWHGRGAGDPAIRLIATTIARRAASSPLALRRTLARRRSLLSTATPAPAQTALPWDEQDDGDHDLPVALLARHGLASGADERSWIERLLGLAKRARSAKIAWVTRFLSRCGEPAIVFTEYRDTVDEILAALPGSFRALSITGAHAPDQRRHAVETFNGGGGDVLVATDTAGEGLNLHRRCRLVIDVELPWNPQRLEQRIGRVDRLGQNRRVHAVRLIHPGSIEERVLARLRERRALSETEVAQWVFTDAAPSPRVAWSPASAAVPVAAAETGRLWHQRRHASRTERCVARGLGDAAAFIAVHRITLTNTLGNVLAECAAAHQVARRHAGALDAAMRTAIGRHGSDIESALTPLRAAIRDRVARIDALVGKTPRETQRSLFDSRADAAARRADATRRHFQLSLARRRDSITAPVDTDGAVATLVTAWPSRRP